MSSRKRLFDYGLLVIAAIVLLYIVYRGLAA